MHKIRIIHIINSLGDGGAEGVLYRLVKNTKHDFEHIVISLLGPGKYSKKFSKLAIRTYYLNLNRSFLKFDKIFYLLNILNKNKKNSIIQTWLYHADLIGGICARLCGIKKIFWNIRVGEVKFAHNKITTIFFIFFCSLFSRVIPFKIIACGKKAMCVHKKIGYSGKFSVVYNGFNINYKNEKKKVFFLKKKFKIQKRDFVIGNVARFHTVKNHKLLIDSFEILNRFYKNTKLILIGTDVDEKNLILKKQIKQLNLENKVYLLGKIDFLDPFYQLFDLFVLPSSSEGFPNVLAEAMKNRIVTLGADVGEVKKIIGNTGWIFNQFDPMIISSKILKIIKLKNNRKIWNKKKIDSQKRIKNYFSIDTMKNKYSKLWKS